MGTGRLRTVVAVLITGFVVGCAGEGNGGGEGDPVSQPANLAFIDVAATSAVSEEIAPAVTRFFSYDYRQLDEHSAQIMADSTAKYWAEVEPTLGVVRQVASAQQVVTTAEVVATSVHLLEPSRAELLLFLNRSTTRTGVAPQQEPSSVIVTAARIGPAWKLEGMRVL